MDFLAGLYGVAWSWIYDQIPVLWLSFILVGVCARLPFDLWSLIRVPGNYRRDRARTHLVELQTRVEDAAGTRSDHLAWKEQQIAKLLSSFSSESGGCAGSLSGCLGAVVGLAFSVTVFIAAYFALTNPQSSIEPGSALWAALFGGSSGAASAPAPVDFFGTDFRIRFVDGVNTAGWVLYVATFAGQQIITLLFDREALIQFKAHYKALLGTIVPLAIGFFFLPVGLTALELARGILGRIKSALRGAITKSGASKWNEETDARLKALAMPDSFFEPPGPEGEEVENAAHPVGAARRVVSNLMAAAHQQLQTQFPDGAGELTKPISELEPGAVIGDVRMIIKPGSEGNEVVFLGEDAPTIDALKKVTTEMEARADALPIEVVHIQVSDTLLDGRTMDRDESSEE